MEKKFPITLLTVFIVVGLTLAYTNTTGVAPFIPTIIDHYGLDGVQDQTLINLLISIVFPLFAIFAFVGTAIGKRFGVWMLFFLILLLTGVGTSMTVISGNSITLLMAGRIIFACGMGMNIPFSGMRVLAWYRPKAREKMNALDSMQALFGSMLNYLFAPGLALLIGGGDMDKGFLWAIALPGFIVLIIWVLFVIFTSKKEIDKVNLGKEEQPDQVDSEKEKGMFRKLIKRKDIVMLIIMVVCDFGVFVTFSSILPRWIMMVGGMSEYASSIWTGLGLSLFSVLGVLIGTSIVIKTGKRKPMIVFAQLLKCAAILLAVFGGGVNVWLLVVAGMMYGFGNASWMMPMAQVVMELPGMNHARFGGGLALIQASSTTAGLVIPLLQGTISTFLINSSNIAGENAQLLYGFKWSMLVFGIMSVAAIICSFFITETGKGKSPMEIPLHN